MAHDVFISHSTRDKPVSDAVCAALENAGIRCWVAPRDVQPGRSFAGEITRAIQQSKAMVLIFSAHSNNSSQVLREVQLAVESQLHILQFRIEEVLLNDDLKYYLSTPHWLDALTPPLENHLGRLSTSIKTLLGKSETAPAGASAPPPVERSPSAVAPTVEQERPPFVSAALPPAKPPQRNFWIPALVGLVVICGIVLAAILFQQSQRSKNNVPPQTAAPPPAVFSVTPVPSPPPQPTATTNPPVAAKTAVYHFDESAGNIARDSSGNGRHLSMHGSVGFVGGLPGYALSFPDSNESYARREIDDPVFNLGDADFTLEFACRLNDFAHEQVLIEKFSGRTGPGWTLTLINRATLVFHADGAASFKAAVQLEPRRWYGLKVQRRASRLKIFVDATEVLDQPIRGFITASPNPLLLGRRNQEDGRSFPLNGAIDELQIEVATKSTTAAISKPFQQSWDFSAGMLPGVRIEGVEVANASDKTKEGKYLRFVTAGRSFLEATFDVPDGMAGPTRLTVRHLWFSPDDKQPGYSPIRITLNGNEIFRGSPAGKDWMEEQFDLGNYVQPGRNTLLWEYLEGAQAPYLLKSFRLSSGNQ